MHHSRVVHVQKYIAITRRWDQCAKRQLPHFTGNAPCVCAHRRRGNDCYAFISSTMTKIQFTKCFVVAGLLLTTSISGISCSWMVFMWLGSSRFAKMPPWTAGCNVFTRPAALCWSKVNAQSTKCLGEWTCQCGKKGIGAEASLKKGLKLHGLAST